MKNDKNKLSVKDRIKRILEDEEFRSFCERCQKENSSFEDDFKISEKVAQLSMQAKADFSLLQLGDERFSAGMVEKCVVDFYKSLDVLTPEMKPLMNDLLNNRQYVSLEDEKTDRSYCCYSRDENDKEHRNIFINLEGRVGDACNAIHEMCHSLSKGFIEGKRPKDRRMSEICTVICDNLSNTYLMNQFPELKKNFIANSIHAQVLNVSKARESLLDGLIIKLMTGQMSVNECEKKYSGLFLNHPGIVLNCIKNIENYEFTNMLESKYLVPQAVSLYVADIFKDNPKKGAEMFKMILENDCDWTLEETLQYLGIESVESLIDEYVAKFPERMKALEEDFNKTTQVESD